MQFPYWVKCSALVVSIMLAIVLMVMGIVVVSDDSANRLLNREVCYGNMTNLVTDHAGICYRASVDLKFGNNLPVTLDFPAINWMLVCESESSVDEWIEGLDGNSFDCWAAPPNYNWNHSVHGSSRGFKDQYDHGRIIGWTIMMSIGIAWLGILLLTMCCVACCACCNGDCRCFSWSISNKR